MLAIGALALGGCQSGPGSGDPGTGGPSIAQRPLPAYNTIATEYTIVSLDPAKRRAHAEVTCRNQRGETVAVAVNIRAFVD